MSEQETLTGKIKKIFSGTEEEIELICSQLCSKHGYEIENFHFYYRECLIENTNTYIVLTNHIFEILEIHDLKYDSFCHLSEKEQDIYEFTTSFYNGGTCLSEMIEEALNNMEK